MIVVNFFATLRAYLNKKHIRLQADKMSVYELLHHCEARSDRPFLHILLDDDDSIRPGATILVNGQNIIQLQGMKTIVRNGANVVIFSPEQQEQHAEV